MSNRSFYEKIKDLCYVRRAMPEVITRRERIEGEEWFVVFDEVNQKLYKFKGNAGKIWKMLDGKHSVEKIVQTFCEEGTEPEEAVIKDVSRFISKAGRKNLIKAAVKRVQPGEVTNYEDLVGRSPLP